MTDLGYVFFLQSSLTIFISINVMQNENIAQRASWNEKIIILGINLHLEDGRNKDDRIFNENVTFFLFLIHVEWLLFKWVIRIQEMKKKHLIKKLW